MQLLCIYIVFLINESQIYIDYAICICYYIIYCKYVQYVTNVSVCILKIFSSIRL